MRGNRYQFVVDVDGVMLDVVTPALEHLYKVTGVLLEHDDIVTYDFNGSADDKKCQLTELTSCSYAYDTMWGYIGTQDCYKKCRVDLGGIKALRNIAEVIKREELPVDIVFHTQTYTPVADDEKRAILMHYLYRDYGDVIRYQTYIGTGKKEAYDDADVIIEDSIDNIKGYPKSCMRCLVGRSYNADTQSCNVLPYDYFWGTTTFKRTDTTKQAIEEGFKHILQLIKLDGADD